MTMSQIDRDEELDMRDEVDLLDPRFVERERNEYASRAVGYVVLLNGVAGIALLIGLSYGMTSAETLESVGHAMVIFGAGTLAALASALFAYFGRTVRLEMLLSWRRPFRWLAVVAIIVGALCFIIGLNTARTAVLPDGPLQGAPTTQPEAPDRVNP